MLRIITEGRIVLRPFERADAAALLRAMRCPMIAQMRSGQIVDEGSAIGYLDVLEGEYRREYLRTLAIALREGNRAVGLLTLDRDRIFPRAELSYWIDIDHRNSGLATEAVQAALRYGFIQLGLRRIQAMHFRCNPASGRVLVKAGLRYEGTLRGYIVLGDMAHDCLMYAALSSD